MRRREFITLLGGAAATWPLAARAQQPGKVARIGYLGLTTPSSHAKYSQAFRDGLRRLGYVEGTNVVIDFRFAEENTDRLTALAAELVRNQVDVIVTYATGVPVAQRTTATIPIVMATYGDAVSTGVVASLAQPGGNVTGSTFFNPELMVKRLELLKEMVPSMTKSGVLLIRGHELNGPILQAMAMTAEALSVTLQPFEIGGPGEFESAFTAWADKEVGAVVIQDHAFLTSNTKAIAALAAKQWLPSAGPLELPANGGLMAYGVNFLDQFRRAAVFVDKILKGAKPGDLPVEQPTKFELVINLKTAKALGLDVPAFLQQRADEVIE